MSVGLGVPSAPPPVLAPRRKNGRRCGGNTQTNGHVRISYWNRRIGFTTSAVTVSAM